MIRLPFQYFKVTPCYHLVAVKHMISHRGSQSSFYMFTWSWFSETLTFICLNVLPIYGSLQVPHEGLTKFINKYISKYINNLYIKKHVMFTVSKKQLYLLLSFMGKMSALVKSGLTRSLHKRLTLCKVKIIFQTSNPLKNYFRFKDVVPQPLRSCQIYNFTCRSCCFIYW